MEEKGIEILQPEELSLLKGGVWRYVNGEWKWFDDDEGEEYGPGLDPE